MIEAIRYSVSTARVRGVVGDGRPDGRRFSWSALFLVWYALGPGGYLY
ncbi:MAG: hypothetical protein ACRDQ0_05440 [Pseudonocardia sp.]